MQSKGSAIAVQGFCHCSPKLLPLQSMGSAIAVQGFCHFSPRLLPVQSKASACAVQGLCHCSPRLLPLQSKASAIAVQGLCQKLRKYIRSTIFLFTICEQGPSSHWNISLGFCSSKKVRNYWLRFYYGIGHRVSVMGGWRLSFNFQIKFGTQPRISKIYLIPLKILKRYFIPSLQFSAKRYIRKAYLIALILEKNFMQLLALQQNHQLTDTLSCSAS